MATVKVGGREVGVQLLKLGALRRLHEGGALAKAPARAVAFVVSVESIDAAAVVLGEAFRQSDATITQDQVLAFVEDNDGATVSALVMEVLGSSGAVPQGEAKGL